MAPTVMGWAVVLAPPRLLIVAAVKPAGLSGQVLHALFCFKETQGIAPCGLGPVHRVVCPFQWLITGGAGNENEFHCRRRNVRS